MNDKKEYKDRLEQLVHSTGTLFQQNFVFKVFDLEMDVGFFRTYWDQIEGFLGKQSEEIRQQLNEALNPETGNMETSYFYQAARAFQLEEIDKYTQFLRQSFLTSIFSYLESNLFIYARLIGADDALTFNTLDDVKDYLIHEAKIDYSFERSSLWQELQGFRAIRNCIVHHQAETRRLNASRKRKVLHYIKKRDDFLSLKEGKIKVHKGYPEHIIELIDQFCWSILVSASDRFKKIM